MNEKKKKVSIYDIAAVLGVSGSTVSRALQNHPAISEKVREQVRKTAREMNYKPNALAVNLKRGYSKTIGVVVPYINRNFFSSAIEGIEEVANRMGYDVLICQSNELYEKEQKILHSLSQGKVDGVIASIAYGTRDYSHYNNLAEDRIPLVLFDRVSDEVKAGMVRGNDYQGAYRVVRYLLSTGRKRIFHCAGFQHVSVWRDRYRGYWDALQAYGITPEADWVRIGGVTRDAGVAFAREILQGKALPDAVFVASDFVALGILLELMRNGVKVPEEVAIFGYANESFDELITPSLSSVDQFSKQMGQAAARMLIGKLNGEHPEDVLIEPELILRDSTRAQGSDFSMNLTDITHEGKL
ncbi:MAG: LacI family transcriptional regulator [Culturomica sp.]|jgi:LacI family transcriptional regulator|nr:LacI family transcriptional regulator [Culturomica sp.]